MNKVIFFTLSLMVVSAAYSVAPQTAAEVKKAVVTCKCNDKCTVACACPQCPLAAKNKEAATVKEAAATQAVANKH